MQGFTIYIIVIGLNSSTYLVASYSSMSIREEKDIYTSKIINMIVFKIHIADSCVACIANNPHWFTCTKLQSLLPITSNLSTYQIKTCSKGHICTFHLKTDPGNILDNLVTQPTKSSVKYIIVRLRSKKTYYFCRSSFWQSIFSQLHVLFHNQR